METEEQNQLKNQFIPGFFRKNAAQPVKYQEFDEEDIESIIFELFTL